MIVASEAANGLLDRYSYVESLQGLRIKINNELAQDRRHSFDILVFGTCYDARGVMAPLMEKETGLSCYNFAPYDMQTILASYCMLKNYLKTHPQKPKYIIIGANRMNISKPLTYLNIPYFYDFRKGNIAEFASELGPAQAVNFLLPSQKHQHLLRRFFEAPFSFKTVDRKRIDDFIEKVYRERGYDSDKEDVVYGGDANDRSEDPKFTVSGYYYKYIRAMLDLAGKNNIRVIYSMSSRPPDWYELEERHGIVKQYNAFVDLLKREYPALIVLNPQRLLNEKDMYSSSSHLNKKGARLLTRFLSEALTDQIQKRNDPA